MTTICTDGVTIAADGLACLGGQKVAFKDRKIVIDRKHGAIYALSGATAMLPHIMEWHRAGAPAESAPKAAAPDITWTLLVITSKSTTLLTSQCAFPSVVDDRRFAIGSGADYAMGAMCAGVEPAEAVKIVIDNKLDVWTGGEIQVENIAEALGLQCDGKLANGENRHMAENVSAVTP